MITVSLFLYIYFTFLVIWVFFNLAIFYHLLRYGMKNFFTFFAMAAYLFAVYIVFTSTFALAAGIDWQKPIIELPGKEGATMWK